MGYKERIFKIKTSEVKEHTHEFEIDPELADWNGQLIVKSSVGPDNHIHYLILDKDDVEYIVERKYLELDTTKNEGHRIETHKHTLIFNNPNIKESKDVTTQNIITETPDYKLFTEADNTVFELKNRADFEVFFRGLKERDMRKWRYGSETTKKLIEALNEHKGKSLVIRYQDGEYRPYVKMFK